MKYKILKDNQLIEKDTNFTPIDRNKTLDCIEYMNDKRLNKYYDCFQFSRGVEKR